MRKLVVSEFLSLDDALAAILLVTQVRRRGGRRV